MKYPLISIYPLCPFLFANNNNTVWLVGVAAFPSAKKIGKHKYCAKVISRFNSGKGLKDNQQSFGC